MLGLLMLSAFSSSGCGGGGGGSGDSDWYYHFSCNGDAACLSTNFASAPSGTSDNLGPGVGGQSSCNSLMNFGRINWNVPPTQQWCDNTAAFNPPPGPHIDVTVSPTTIELGQSATVSWTGGLVSICNASSSWSGSKPTSGTQIVTPTGIGNATYGLTCTGPNGQATGAANLIVKGHPPSVTLSVSPAGITLGQQATLMWSSQTVSNCTASGPWSGSKATSGTQIVTPASAGSFDYTLSCVGSRGTATRTATVTVSPNGGPTPPAPPTVNISLSPAAPSCIDLGAPAALTWSSSNATSCEASGAWTGPVGLSGNSSVYPAADGSIYQADEKFDYVLSCAGAGGTATASATACANKNTGGSPPPTVSVSVAPGGIALGDGATVTWSSQYASNCVAGDAWTGSLALSGSAVVTPSSTGAFSYTVRCSRAAITVSQTATLSVNVASGSNPLNARFSAMRALSMNATDDLYISDTDNFTIRRIGHDGVVSTLAGLLNNPGSDDGVGAAARFYYAYGIVAGALGNVYVSNSNSMSMRKIAPDATVTTPAGVAGTASGSADGTGATARFYYPWGLTADSSENVYIADFGNNEIRKMTSGGATSTIAGQTAPGFADAVGTSASFNGPSGVARVGTDLYVVDSANFTIRKIASDGTVTTFAGTRGTQGSKDATGTAAQFFAPFGIAADPSGNLYVTDYVSVRKITTPGAVVTTFSSFANLTYGITSDSSGNIYATYLCSIYKITPAGASSLFAGDPNTCGSNN